MTTIITPNRAGLLAYYSFDEGQGSIARDYSGNNNHGTLVGSPTWVDGMNGKALGFSNNGKVTFPSIVLSGDFSFSLWVYYSDTGSNNYGTLISQASASGLWILKTSQNKLNYFFSVDHLSNDSIPVNTWTHVCFTKNGTTGTFYINGKQSGTVAAVPSISISNIGGDVANEFLIGKLCQIRVYNRAISQQEIRTLYQSGQTKLLAANNAGLVGYWSLDEGTGIIARDYSGNNNHGLLVNNPTWVDGIKGKALKFNGTNNYIVSQLAIKTQRNFSYSCWIKWNGSTGTSNFIISNGMSGSNGVGLYISSSATLNAEIASILVFSSGFTMISNIWFFCTLTCDSSVTKIYLNSVLGGGTSLSSPVVPTGNTYVGNTSGGNAGFNGLIDDVRVYNRALSQSEINTLYKSGIAMIR